MVELDDKRISRPEGSEPAPAVVNRPNTPLLSTQDGAAKRVSSAVFGEEVAIHGRQGDFALIRHQHDHYVGWSKLDHLGAMPQQSFTHWVSSPMGHAYVEADLKSAPKTSLFLGSRLIITDTKDDYNFMEGVGWIHKAQISALGVYRSDPCDVALRFLGSPYLWGGRDAFGLDCSALTQLSFAACGTSLPRDSDMQFAWSGAPVENWSEPGALQRNDLIFWRGHVGMMLDEATLLHANGYTMSVSYEPLETAVRRIDDETPYGRPIGAKRISFPDATAPGWLAN